MNRRIWTITERRSSIVGVSRQHKKADEKFYREDAKHAKYRKGLENLIVRGLANLPTIQFSFVATGAYLTIAG